MPPAFLPLRARLPRTREHSLERRAVFGDDRRAQAGEHGHVAVEFVDEGMAVGHADIAPHFGTGGRDPREIAKAAGGERKLQRRIGRKSVGKKMLADFPVIFLAYDVMELDGHDYRETPLIERRITLERLVAAANHERLLLSPIVQADSWDDLAVLINQSRERNVEGFMIKRRESPYRVGRVRGDWWKWKIAPHSIDAVLIYAQRGSGKRASLYTDYTFGVWDGEGKLVPFAKAYSGLTDEEIRQVDSFIRRNTQEKFGPVRTVKPELVFELAFEGIQRSTRHKSGIAVRFPRIARWRHDKPMEEADTLDTIRALLPPESE